MSGSKTCWHDLVPPAMFRSNLTSSLVKSGDSVAARGLGPLAVSLASTTDSIRFLNKKQGLVLVRFDRGCQVDFKRGQNVLLVELNN